ncbi:hypothetical protein OsI_05103 [Oryza sativa Indica Group]|uniref:Uncharacterized protein n=1 Tax=Oryza sativa subsp. indica TaxID=39946 RepID=B8A8U3_ORYSI|nr:hypothetical protein OsI_05103 [Oryza sativa Indica Group]
MQPSATPSASRPRPPCHLPPPSRSPPHRRRCHLTPNSFPASTAASFDVATVSSVTAAASRPPSLMPLSPAIDASSRRRKPPAPPTQPPQRRRRALRCRRNRHRGKTISNAWIWSPMPASPPDPASVANLAATSIPAAISNPTADAPSKRSSTHAIPVVVAVSPATVVAFPGASRHQLPPPPRHLQSPPPPPPTAAATSHRPATGGLPARSGRGGLDLGGLRASHARPPTVTGERDEDKGEAPPPPSLRPRGEAAEGGGGRSGRRQRFPPPVSPVGEATRGQNTHTHT